MLRVLFDDPSHQVCKVEYLSPFRKGTVRSMPEGVVNRMRTVQHFLQML